MNKNILLWAVLAVVVVVGVYALATSQTMAPQTENPPANTATGNTNVPSQSGGVTTGGAPIPSAGKVQVDIKGFAFVSKTTRVAPGTTIVWENFDNVVHNVIGPDFASPNLAKGQQYSHTFTKEGTFTYYCSLHPNMSGEVVVRAF